MYFDKLHVLEQHIPTLRNILGSQDFFVVGGAIRDILLGISPNPTDIDITLSADPETLRTHIEQHKEDDMSCFRTDKYGTITLIKHTDTAPYEYEVTPFRVEGSYTDVRHPDDIIRSKSIIDDSKRRDFTVNCLYRYSFPGRYAIELQDKQIKTIKNNEQCMQIIKKEGYIYLDDSQTYILREKSLIERIFVDGIFQENIFKEILESIPYYYTLSTTPYTRNTRTISIIVDPHGGLADLSKQVIRTVGTPEDRFQEDALRILRGVRFPNILNQYLPNKHEQNTGFTFEKHTRNAMCSSAHLVQTLAKERIHQELVKIFHKDNPFGYIALLDELGLIEALFPALALCKHNTQPTLYHPFDTYIHTLLTVEALQKINTHYLAKLAMLYHDVGKPEQYAYISEQKEKNPDDIDMSSYTHHTDIGVMLAKQDFQHLGFSKKEIEEICWYIKRHHRPGEILASNKKNHTKKIRQLLSEGGREKTINLIDIAIADRSGQFNPLQSPAVEELHHMKEVVQDLHTNEGRFTLKELAVNGNILMSELGIQSGPYLGILLQKAFDRVIGDIATRNNTKDILTHLESLTGNENS